MAKLSVLKHGRIVVFCSPYEGDSIVVRIGQRELTSKRNLISLVSTFLNTDLSADRIYGLTCFRRLTTKEQTDLVRLSLSKYESSSFYRLLLTIVGEDAMLSYLRRVLYEKEHVMNDVHCKWNMDEIEQNVIDPVMEHSMVKTAQESKKSAFREKWRDFIVSVCDEVIRDACESDDGTDVNDDEILGPLSYMLDARILIINAFSRRLCRVYNMTGKTKCLMLLAHERDHYEVIGRLQDGNDIQTAFNPEDELVVRIIEDVPEIH